MADPLSIATNVIAVAMYVANVSSVISNMRMLGELPGRLHALKNEVTDLELVLRQVGPVLSSRHATTGIDGLTLQEVIGRANSKLVDLSRLLGRITDVCVKAKAKMVNRAVVW